MRTGNLEVAREDDPGRDRRGPAPVLLPREGIDVRQQGRGSGPGEALVGSGRDREHPRVVLLIASRPLNVSGDGEADFLREAHAHGGSVLLSGAIQVAAFLLLALPLLYLFRAVQVRSDRVRSQLIGLVIAAPLFLAASSAVAIGVTSEAADSFVACEAKPDITVAEAREDCSEERDDEGVDFLKDEYDPAPGTSPLRACEDRKLQDDAASQASRDASLAPLATGLGLAGALGFVVSLLYIGLVDADRSALPLLGVGGDGRRDRLPARPALPRLARLLRLLRPARVRARAWRQTGRLGGGGSRPLADAR